MLPYADGNLVVYHYNADSKTGAPLVLSVNMICNTDDETRASNVTVNSRSHLPWLKQAQAHDGVAVICGSGPSIRDDVARIRDAMASGATVFALNGACKWLNGIGIVPDYQVMIDARRENITLLGDARHHLLASQCQPDLVDYVNDTIIDDEGRPVPGRITLVHVLWDLLDECLPQHDDDYAVIGSAPSVGTMALFIAYTLGFRKIELYGYDSSHKSETDTHAVAQPMNAGEPVCEVVWNGTTYRTSIVMKAQAEQFPEVKRTMESLGCTVDVFGSGLLPDMVNTPLVDMPEADKYRHMWSVPEYRRHSPAEAIVDEIANALPIGRVLDLGCGTARAAVDLERMGFSPVLVDFASNCRDHEALHLPFYEADLSNPLPVTAPSGYCCDVMEHIPPKQVDDVLSNIAAAVDVCLFRIEMAPDSFGPAVIGQPLHLSVHDEAWWHETLNNHFATVSNWGDGVFFARGRTQ